MSFTPKQICEELNKYIIGQDKAKKAVAIALRNRYRRSQLSEELQEEITPKNIIMKGPTGVGKTEIARRLAKLVSAPFVKIEATKFTEVGYVGRDVESMVRDLVEVSIRMVKEENRKKVEEKAKETVDKIILDALYIQRKASGESEISGDELKEKIKQEYNDGLCEKEIIEVELADAPKNMEMFGGIGMEINIGDMFGGLMPAKKRRRKVSVKEARKALMFEEADKLIDQDNVNVEAIRRVEQEGIIFIDEIDKIASNGKGSSGPEVSREGVQRDILPIVEGCTVSTKYGSVRTDYILFIAAGAFHISSVEDLIPELQGRFPIRVNLDNLSKQDFLKILTQPQNAIVKQYTELLRVDKINLKFNEDALERIAEIAETENETSENIGARRLHTVIEQLLEDISYNAGNNDTETDVIITKEYVESIFSGNIKQYNLRKFII
ncbi:MAG: ATP-dependent protease ATPase subunit HslU [Clostridia bacterium]|nr:ATP-dependent protease ATPase subunit HslU [Clostridia bacterium]